MYKCTVHYCVLCCAVPLGQCPCCRAPAALSHGRSAALPELGRAAAAVPSCVGCTLCSVSPTLPGVWPRGMCVRDDLGAGCDYQRSLSDRRPNRHVLMIGASEWTERTEAGRGHSSGDEDRRTLEAVKYAGPWEAGTI